MGSAIDLEIPSGFGEAQLTIYGASYDIRVRVVLTIVLPPADRAKA